MLIRDNVWLMCDKKYLIAQRLGNFEQQKAMNKTMN